MDKSYEGAGIKDLASWNKAIIAKLVWTVAKNKYVQWVKWVHERYIKDKNWWNISHHMTQVGIGRRLVESKRNLREVALNLSAVIGREDQNIRLVKVMHGLNNHRGRTIGKNHLGQGKFAKKCIYFLVMINHRLPTKQRIAKHQNFTDITCVLCCAEDETDEHLFFTCSYAKEIWGQLGHWWASLPSAQDSNQLLRYMRKAKDTRVTHQVTSSIITAILYHIWTARNQRIFRNQQLTASQIVYLIKDQVKSRILFLNTCSRKYGNCIDRLLS